MGGMAFCGKCGTSVAEGVDFCPKCGSPTGSVVTNTPVAASAGGPAVTPVVTPATSGLTENVAGLLCYLVGWLTGIIFLLIDKRPFVRFHAAQSIVVFGVLFILRILLSYGLLGSYGFFGYHALGMFWLWTMISLLVSLVTLVAWVVLMVMAYQGKHFEVPIAAGIAKSLAGKVQ
jgi:uncharacterized membrane protein